MAKKDYLKDPVKHIDFTDFDARKLIREYSQMSFSARDLALAAEIFVEMLSDKNCSVWLTIAGSTGAAGCLKVFADMVFFNMVDVVVATGAAIVDMDFFEALGFRHYKGSSEVDDRKLRRLRIDRIYDTFIDEGQLQQCDMTIARIADSLVDGVYSSREFIVEMGRCLEDGAKKHGSLVENAYNKGVPIFCPAFSDSSAGFGLVYHQTKRSKSYVKSYVTIDSVKDLRELTQIKTISKETGLFMVGGGVAKNFAQDTVICAEVLGKKVPMHKYAVQISVADVRDGGLSGSTLKEASSWGKVEQGQTQMVFAEATLVVPLLASYAYHSNVWKERKNRNFNLILSK